MFQQGFLREHSSTMLLFLAALDMAALVLSGAGCFWWLSPIVSSASLYQMAVILTGLLTLISFSLMSLYSTQRGASMRAEMGRIIVALTMVFILFVLFMFFTKTSSNFSRLWTGWWFLSSTSFIIGFRALVRASLNRVRQRGYNLRHIVILSQKGIGEHVVQQLNQMPFAGFNVLGYFCDQQENPSINSKGACQRGTLAQGIEFLDQHRVDQLWLAMPLSADQQIDGILKALPYLTADIRLIPDMSSFRLINHSISMLGNMPIINLSVTPIDGTNRLLKSIEDKLLALLILLLISPMLIALSIGVKLSSPGPIFYRQKRVSWNGKTFKMYKFRSMPVDTEGQSGAVWASADEQRATRFGALLRRSSLDELPQFWNVLKGDMSIVGPRPERPVFVEKFRDEIPGYMQKHMVKAGITGWAQVNGWRGDTDLQKRVEFDLYYIEHWSLGFDLRIIFLTLIKGFAHKNAY